jgi:hypothetical protein
MKNIKAPNIVIVGVITVITIVLWIIFGVYKLVSTPQDVNVPTNVLSPLSPTLNQEALNTLEGRIFFSEGELSGVNLISTPEPEESPSPTPSPTPEEEQEEATESAEQETATGAGETAQ